MPLPLEFIGLSNRTIGGAMRPSIGRGFSRSASEISCA
jgi:hypothetical protein